MFNNHFYLTFNYLFEFIYNHQNYLLFPDLKIPLKGKGSLPTLQIPLGIVALFAKIYDGEPILFDVSNSVHCTIIIPVFQLSVWFEKCDAARHYDNIGKQLSLQI